MATFCFVCKKPKKKRTSKRVYSIQEEIFRQSLTEEQKKLYIQDLWKPGTKTYDIKGSVVDSESFICRRLSTQHTVQADTVPHDTVPHDTIHHDITPHDIIRNDAIPHDTNPDATTEESPEFELDLESSKTPTPKAIGSETIPKKTPSPKKRKNTFPVRGRKRKKKPKTKIILTEPPTPITESMSTVTEIESSIDSIPKTYVCTRCWKTVDKVYSNSGHVYHCAECVEKLNQKRKSIKIRDLISEKLGK